RGLDLALPRRAVSPRRPDEVLEERVAREGLGLQLRVELAAEEPRMVAVELDDLDEFPIGGHPRERESGLPQRREVLLVDLVAVAVAAGDRALAVGAGRDRPGGQLARVLAQSHRAAEGLDTDQVPQLEDDLVFGLLLELGRIGALEAGDVPGVLDDRRLEP